MKYALDTNTCIRFINGRAPKLRTKIPSIPASDIIVCSVVFDEKAAMVYGTLRANLEATGIVIGAYDMMIAAVAMVHNLILVTHNTKHFTRIVGLKIEDWEL